MNIVTIIKGICAAIVGAITTLIPCIITIVKSIKARKLAKTEAEKEAAKNDMLISLNLFVATAEETYKDVNSILKQQGKSCGAIKKENVLTKLQAYALQKGYEFDVDFWSAKIDDVVALTKSVNIKI